ncbi:hypothetical protein PybrP1_009820 [[Pythium] brassicae (nom. inval.)]|nr:hypothetical protein PybrP1_009820 [[Pythium] brassicae (nom. inval.)]
MDKGLLTRATSKEDSPTPGYLYGEIARMTQHSFDTCTKVLEFLISRVKNKHHTVKFKALQVIKHVCRDGRVDFKREMQKHIPTIKECLQFRGPPDPLKGDEYYRRVRDSAKDVLDAIYDTDSAPGLGGMGMSARIQGVSNPANNAAESSGWSAKIWGKGSSGDNMANLPPPPMGGGPMPGYGGAPSQYGYPSDPNQGGYAGPQAPGGAYGQQQPSYQPEYPPQASFGGPAPYGGGPSQYGAPPAPYNDQKFSGIGNPMYQDARDEKGFFQGLKEKAASKFITKSDGRPAGGMNGAPPGMSNAPEGWTFPTNRGPTSGNYGPSAGSTYNPEETYRPSGFVGGGYRAGSSAYGASNDSREVVSSQLREKAYDGDRKKGRVGGAWGSEPAPQPAVTSVSSGGRDNRESRSMSRGGGQDYGGYDAQQRAPPSSGGNAMYAQPPSSGGSAMYAQPPSSGGNAMYAQPALTGQTSGAQSDGSYERNLVTALCAPGGMRAVPPKDKLDAFVKSALTLDAEIVGPILEDCLADQQWTVVSKALATIDTLLKADGCEDFFEYFSENYSEIDACAQSDKAAVRDRAVKILSAIGQSTSAAPSAAPRVAPKARGSRPSSNYQQQQQPQADLLGDFSDPAPASDSGSDIFSGLQTSAPAPQPAAPVANDVVDMFGGLNLQASAPASMPAPEAPMPAAPVAAPAAPAPAQTLVLDPLLEPVPTPNPLLNPSYGGMNMGMMGYVIGAAMTPTGYIAKTIDEPSDVARGDSGFGFMKKKDDSFNFVMDAMKNS